MQKVIKIGKAINQLKERGFKKTVDSISEYSNNADLYFRSIDHKRFIVFNHYNKTKKEDLQGFDCWISTYSSEGDIGKKPANEVQCIRLTFDFEDDWMLLSEYF